MTPPAALTVYYDGACPLCSAEIRTYRRSRGAERLTFVDVSGDDAPATLGPDLSREAAQARFHVRDDQGRLASGASGFIRLWRELPGWGWLAAFASLPGMPILAEAAYRGFLPLRPHLAKLFSRFSGTSCDTACRPPKA
ncbi:thiol-disulfide oxidoreductase DCC family protein [Methylobacterium sp. CM6241]